MPQIEAGNGTGNFVTKNTSQTITADKTFDITSGSVIPITAIMDSSAANQPAILAKNNTNFAQAGNILKIQMVNASDSGDVVRIENAGTGKSLLGTDGSTTQFSIDRKGNAALNAATGITYQSQSATVGTFVLGASTKYMVEDHLEIGSTASLEVPSTSSLEVFAVATAANTMTLSNKTFNGPLWDGWENVTADNWTWASSTQASLSGNAAGNYAVGDRIKVFQLSNSSLPAYFVVTGVSTILSQGTIQISGGSDYSLQNATINAVYVSHMATPVGFPQWFSFTLNWTNLTIGSGSSATARFTVNGRTCQGYAMQVLGSSGSSVGTGASFTAPVAPSSNIQNNSFNVPLGTGWLNAGGSGYMGYGYFPGASTQIRLGYFTPTSSILAAVDATHPTTWAVSNALYVNFIYEI